MQFFCLYPLSIGRIEPATEANHAVAGEGQLAHVRKRGAHRPANTSRERCTSIRTARVCVSLSTCLGVAPFIPYYYKYHNNKELSRLLPHQSASEADIFDTTGKKE